MEAWMTLTKGHMYRFSSKVINLHTEQWFMFEFKIEAWTFISG